MADMSNISVNVNDAMRNITINCRVTGTRVLSARIGVGIFFIKLAARIMGCGVNVEMENK